MSKCGSLFLGLSKVEHLTLLDNLNDLSSPSIPVSWKILEFPIDISLIIGEHSLPKRTNLNRPVEEECVKDLRNLFILSCLDNFI